MIYGQPKYDLVIPSYRMVKTCSGTYGKPSTEQESKSPEKGTIIWWNYILEDDKCECGERKADEYLIVCGVKRAGVMICEALCKL